jgi:CSLREA domain-containing protein
MKRTNPATVGSTALRVLLGSALLTLAPARASAVDATVTYLVNTLTDQVDDNTTDGLCHTIANTCSLRAAIMQANHLSTNGRVEINVPAGIYRLTIAPSGANGEASGDLNLTLPADPGQRLYMTGVSALSTVIDANQTDRAITISAGRTATIGSMTLRNGSFTDPSGLGGGIQNRGTLSLIHCIVENNYSPTAGGGIGNDASASLFISDSIIRSNAAAYSGAGLYLAGTSSISYSTVSANVAVGAGGGVLVSNGGTALFRATTINANVANNGGGVYVDSNLLHPEQIAQLTLVNCTLSGNVAYTDGGGINNRARAFAYSSSIIDNDADHDRDPMGGIGGGVNTASGLRFVAVNSLIARNTILDAPIYDDCSGTLEVYGRNLFYEVGGCVFSGNGTAARGFVTLASIGPLQDNGGPTLTHALLAGSAAINATTAQGCVDETGVELVIDQRDGLRGAGLNCDVGAFEYGATVPVFDRIFANGFEASP